MNIAEYSITRKVVLWMIIVLMIAGGVIAYKDLARYEDPEFTIKEAKVMTQYNGATPLEVEQEVTDRIEKAIQQMPQIKRITSLSRPGISDITVVIKDKYTSKDLPQVWDELRRKVSDIQHELPPGAGPSLVNDDYGDVYGMYYALVGPGFSYRELKHYADLLKKQLSLTKGVAKVVIGGEQDEAIFVDISHTKMAQLGISQEQIYRLLKSQNFVAYSGSVRVGDEYIRISPTGEFSSVGAIGDILIRSNKSKRLIRLSDVAQVTRGYKEVPSNLVYFDGKRALTLGISIVSGGNVVKIGQAVKNTVKTVGAVIPVGIQIKPIYNQPELVKASVNGFAISVLEALAIVIAVLLIFMGLRSGLIIGAILLLTVLGTLFIMLVLGLDLQRISLGALIIALGMMVDNAIVVVEGILVQTQRGIDALTASKETVSRTMWPLLGATIIGILAFAPISLSQDSTGEYTASLFYVVGISLILSWILAIMAAPLFGHMFLKPAKNMRTQEIEESRQYDGTLFRLYRGFLSGCIKARWLTLMVLAGLLVASCYGFLFVKQSFFPNSTNPLFYINFWGPQGMDIRATANEMNAIEKHIRTIPGITSVTSVVGQGATRFMLVYSPEKANTSYGQFLIGVKNYDDIDRLSREVKNYILKSYPNNEPKTQIIRLGPGKTSKIEVRFSGPDPKVLRMLSEEAQKIMHANPMAIDVRDDWRAPTKIIVPVFSEQQARQTGISREALSDALETAFTGKTVGLYREGDKLIPIISRPPDQQRLDAASIDDVQIWSPLLQKSVPVGQIVSRFKTKWEDSIVHRRNRIPTITVSTDPLSGPVSAVFNQLRPKIEAIKLPPGYKLEWGGEYEDSHDAQVALAKNLPLGFISMFVITVILFGAMRQALIIWLSVPLAVIGVTVGLLSTNTEFGFMALLGFLSLTGMLIKNAIVLIDQIDFEIAEGKEAFQAIIDSALSRARPVFLAALTTVLGMIPLLPDAFFSAMAVVIMFGLSFATGLTLIVVPVLYAVFFRVKTPELATA